MTRYFLASNGITPLQLFGTATDAVDQQQHLAGALIAVRDTVTVQHHDLEVRGGVAVGGVRFASRLGSETTAGAAATAAQAVAPTNRVFMAFMRSFAPVCCPPRGDLSLMIARSLPDRLRVCRPALLACAHYSHKQRSSRFAHNAQRWVGLLSALIQLVSGSTTHEPWRSTPVTASSESSTTKSAAPPGTSPVDGRPNARGGIYRCLTHGSHQRLVADQPAVVRRRS